MIMGLVKVMLINFQPTFSRVLPMSVLQGLRSNVVLSAPASRLNQRKDFGSYDSCHSGLILKIWR